MQDLWVRIDDSSAKSRTGRVWFLQSCENTKQVLGDLEGRERCGSSPAVGGLGLEKEVDVVAECPYA